ncbi:GDSL-type esterase/lipase family protein [Rhodopila sp.]|uniref:GDSL-type esterase/lipase family protein n=1 Tax=Rhodopila sp. TaxID=2480087 RepID=UPI002C5C12B1|nr:GDSL-type esterase/lipase family protein [Rhodopila sp.]HVZ06415.1 GDSL-type esterase/lipase family protein [Rhodopila sp.]
MNILSRRSTLRGAAAFTLAAAAPLAAGFGATRTVLAAAPISRMDLPWWRKRHEEKLKELADTQPTLIFLGDSITENWEKSGPPDWQEFQQAWKRFYGDRKAVNLGFKGDTTASLLWRIRNGEVANIKPKVAVVLIGANNFGRVHWDAEETVQGIDAIIGELRKRLPDTKILLLGVLPSDRSPWVTEQTATINKALARNYKSVPMVTYLDLTPIFMKGNTLNRSLFYDPLLSPPEAPLHPTAQGQALMSQTMEPVLSAMLGDRPHG